MGKQAPAATSREIQLEIYYLHLALSRAPGELAQLAGLLQLNQVVTRRGLNLTEGSLCLALSATRLRLEAWPALEKLYEQSSSSSSWTGGAGTGVWSSPPEQKFLTRTTGDW